MAIFSRLEGVTKNDFGQGADEAADSLVRAGVRQEGYTGDDLIEELKERRPPYWVKQGRRKHSLDTMRDRGLMQTEAAENEKQSVDSRLAQDEAAWAETVDEYLNGTLPESKPVVVLPKTPLVLSLLGADKDLPVVTNYSNLNKILVKKHQLPVDVMKQVPRAMTDPVMIFRSKTQPGAFVMLLDLKDEKGQAIIVPVSFDRKRGQYVANYLHSAYGRNEQRIWIEQQIQDGRLAYINKEKSHQWLPPALSQSEVLRGDISLTTDGEISVAETSTVVNSVFDGVDLTHVKTEADLAQAKQSNPDYYQPKGEGLARGATTVLDNGGYLITLFQGADLSTVVHELGHAFTLQLEQLVQEGRASQQMIDDLNTLHEWTAALDDDATLKTEYDIPEHCTGERDSSILKKSGRKAEKSRLRVCSHEKTRSHLIFGGYQSAKT